MARELQTAWVEDVAPFPYGVGGEPTFEHLLEGIEDLGVVIDGHGSIRRIQVSERQAAAEQLVGASFAELLGEESQAEFQWTFRRAVDTQTFQSLAVTSAHGQRWLCQIIPATEDLSGSAALVICTDLTERTRPEQVLVRQQRVLRQWIESHERERRMIADGIHDGFSQHVLGARFRLSAVGSLMGQKPEEALKLLGEAMELLKKSVDLARRFVASLEPALHAEPGLVPAVGFVVDESMAAGGPPVEFVVRGTFGPMSRLLEMSLVRIIQEALKNAGRHSRSDRIRLELGCEDGSVQAVVSDWGLGFDPAGVGAGCFGLHEIRERARLLGGSASIESAPGRGTRVVVTVPVW
jgi:signal transduction histidine kinase